MDALGSRGLLQLLLLRLMLGLRLPGGRRRLVTGGLCVPEGQREEAGDVRGRRDRLKRRITCSLGRRGRRCGSRAGLMLFRGMSRCGLRRRRSRCNLCNWRLSLRRVSCCCSCTQSLCTCRRVG